MSFTKTSAAWVVARLNYDEPLHQILAKSVKPFVDSLTQTGIIERFYFERCYDRGANIHLYIRCNPDFLQALIVPHLSEYYNLYFQENPSFRRVTQHEDFLKNSMQILEYQPDIQKWGGSVGLPIMERHFQSSSQMILDLMAEKKDMWSPDDMFQTAMLMHIGFIDSLNMDWEEAVLFFEYCLFYHATQDFHVHSFESIFHNQKEALLDFHFKLWERLQEKEEFKEDIYNRWLEQCFYTTADIKRTFRLRVLKIESKFSALWTIYALLLQKTNNRLGLNGRDESLIYYLMMRSLEKVGSQKIRT
jgi:thiopeptide-type bacteriocin biosynthesis protein